MHTQMIHCTTYVLFSGLSGISGLITDTELEYWNRLAFGVTAY